jgi:hypothetical protein
MVPQKRNIGRAYPFLRLASAFASLLLVFTVLSDLAINLNNRNSLTSASSAGQTLPGPALNKSAENTQQDTYAAPAAPQAPAAAAAPQLAAPPTPTVDEQARSLAAPASTLDPTQQVIQAMTAAPPGLGMAGTEPLGTPMPGSGAGEATQDQTPMGFMLVRPTEGVPPDQATATLEALPAAPGISDTPAPEAPPAIAADQATEASPEAFTKLAPFTAENQQLTPVPAETQQAAQIDTQRLLRPAEWVFGIIALAAGLAAYLLNRMGNR